MGIKSGLEPPCIDIVYFWDDMFFSTKQQRFQRLTNPWRDRLYGVALRQTNMNELAEDWVQETLLRAWRNFNQLSDDIAVYAWLLKILDHVIVDDMRKEKRRGHIAPVITVDDQDLIKHPCLSPEPFDNAVQAQLNEQISDAIQNLPEGFQQVIVLRDIEGLNYTEVAYILDIPKGTVMSRLSRGRRLLASMLIKSNTVDITASMNKASGENS